MITGKPKVLCSIAARSGSKGVPGKNLKKLWKQPLIAYSINAAVRSKKLDKVVVNTDDPMIAEEAKKCGAEAPFLRPISLSGDDVPLIEVTQHTMFEMDRRGFRADIVVQLSAASPFLAVGRIDESIEMVVDLDCDCAVSLAKIEHSHPYRARRISESGYFENFIQDVSVESFHSRQDLPTLYCTSGALYTRKRELLERYDGSDFALGQKRKGIVVDDIEAVNIDRMIDFFFAEFLIEKGYYRVLA